MGKLFCIVGKSGTGKDTLFHQLLEANLGLTPLIPYTTRPIRANETEGVQYRFVTEQAMHSMEDQGRMIERRAYHTVHGIWYYFTARETLEPARTYLLITTPGALSALTAAFGPDHVVVTALLADDRVMLERSILRENQETAPQYAELCRRFLADREDFKDFDPAAYKTSFVIDSNQPLEQCIRQFRLILETVKNKKDGSAPPCRFHPAPSADACRYSRLCEAYLSGQISPQDFCQAVLCH